MTAKKKTKKKIPTPACNVRDGKPKKPKAPPKKYARSNRRTRDISVSKEMYSKIVKRSAVESTAAGYPINAGKLVDRIMTEYLDGLDMAKAITPADERAAAKIVIGGFVVKDRGIEGPFIHVDAHGHVTKAGLPGAKLAIVSSDKPLPSPSDVVELPPDRKYENSEYDPTPPETIEMTKEDADLVFGKEDADRIEADQEAETERAADAATDEEFGESDRG